MRSPVERRFGVSPDDGYVLRVAEERTIPLRYRGGHPPAKTPVLQGRGVEGRGLLVELSGGGMLGRDVDSLLPLAFDGVSRRHVELTMSAGGASAHLRDLESTNGTLVNGEPVVEGEVLPGDLIRIGAVELEFKVLTAPDLARAKRLAIAWTRLRQLSDRELEVATLVAEGLRSAAIAEQLEITVRTVNSHLEHIYERLQIRSRLVLTRLVIEAQLIDG